MAVITETSRLRIRELTTDDAEFVFGLTNEPSILANIGDKGVRSVTGAENFILRGPWTLQQPPGYGQFGLELKDSGELVGVCGILFRETLDLADVGFALLPQYHRRGLAFEAAEAVMKYGYSTLGIDKIYAMTSENNLASIRLLEKLGLRFEKIIKMSADDPGTALYCLPG